MRLAPKIFLASSLTILVLAGAGAASLHAVGRLVSAHREITTQTLPALRLAGSVRDAMPALARLEARFLLLRDARYAALWDERAARAADELERLRGLVTTERSRAWLGDAGAAFDRYRRLHAEERSLLARGERQQALRLAEREGRALVERVEASLDGLMAAKHAAAVAAQEDAARLERRTWRGVGLALAAAVVLALGATGIIALRMTRSLRALSTATAAVAAGSFRDPVPVARRDELGELARSFNAMATELRDVARLKEEFFATTSHELRSPLVSVREAAHLLREGIPGPLTAKQDRLVTIVGESCDRLLRLVDQILELARLRAGVLPLDLRPVDLGAIVDRAVEELRPQAEEAGLALECLRQGESFGCVGDADRLVQLVVNLGANAIRFTPRGGAVSVGLVDAGAEVEIQVEDTGVGIPALALPHIFDAYLQAHRDHGGSGLGLAIVRGIAEAHGGRVTVESQEGKGSRFTVLLPRARGAG
ncbi:MAG: HAMP domain-containing protein [Candidatus Rokubacteria bacterium]|nr:HAMP domain-containing protein [Candidatus Rokubacteria bacterium]